MEKIKKIIDTLANVNAQDVAVYHFELTSPLYDYFVVATVGQRQANASINYFNQNFKDEINHIEGKDAKGWLLIDLGDVIVHLFDQDSREFYGFDRRLLPLKVTV